MLRKTKEGDEKSGKRTGLLSKRPKLSGSKKTVGEKKEESTEEVKPTKTRTLSTPSPPLKRSSKDPSAPKVASRSSSDTVKSPTKTAAAKTGSQKKLKPGERLERTSAPMSKVKTSSATSTSPTSVKKTPKAKAKSAESISPAHSKTPKSDTASRKSSSDASTKKESRSTSTTPTKARVTAPVTSKKKLTGTVAKHAKSKSLSSTETPRENKISGRIIKTLSGIGQRLKSTTPRDKKTPREKKERKKSTGSSSFRSALESLDEQTSEKRATEKQASEKLIKTSPTPPGKPRRSSASDVSSPTSPATSIKSASKKHKESVTAMLPPETQPVESAPELVVNTQTVDDSPPKQEPVEITAEDKDHELKAAVHVEETVVPEKELPVPETAKQKEEDPVIEEETEVHPTSEKPVVGEDSTLEKPVIDEEALPVHEEKHEVVEEHVRDDDEHAATEEYISLSAGSSHWSIHPNTPVARTAHDHPMATSVRSQSLPSRDASIAGTISRDISPELLHQETEHVSQGLTHEEMPIAEEIKVESPPVAVQQEDEKQRVSEESSVGAEVGSDDAKPEESSAVRKHELQRGSAESSVEAEVGSDDIKMESPPLAAESEVKTAQEVKEKDFESEDTQHLSLEDNVQMMGKLMAPEETLVDKTPTRVVAMDVPTQVGEQHATAFESDAKASLEEMTAEGGFSKNKDRSLDMTETVTVSEASQTKAEPVAVTEATQMNEARDTVPTPELITSSSQTDKANEDNLDDSGSDSLVVYHSGEDEDPTEERREVKERLADLEGFGLPNEPVHEEKSETDPEEEISDNESDHESPSFSTSEWSSDAAFVSEPVDIEDPDLPADPAHSDEDIKPKSTQPEKQTAQPQVHQKRVPEPQQKSLDLQDYVRSDTYSQHLVEDPIDTELMSEMVQSVQSRSYIPSPPHEDDPEEEPRSKKRGRKGNFVMSALCVLGGLGGIAVTVFLLHKRVG